MPARTGLTAWIFLIAGLNVAWAAEAENGVDPFWVLLHEPAVVKELNLRADQQEKYQSMLDQLDLRFFPLRNKSREDGQSGLMDIVAEARQQLKALLNPKQMQRLTQIHLWRIGTNSLLHEEVDQKLGLTGPQRTRLQTILAETQQAAAAIEKQVDEGRPRGPLERKYTELQTSGQKRLLAILKPEQQAAFKELLGKQFDLTKLGQPAYKVPELVNAHRWINSSPLNLADQKGKVVVIHFYACGCINCIHNYPWYRDWQERFGDKEFVMIGIQSPETDLERQFAHVKTKAAEEKLTFPILFDGESENWNAWGNSMWPSVYVVDQHGYLRHFWAGELKWKGNDGEKFLREQIEALLEEGSQ